MGYRLAILIVTAVVILGAVGPVTTVKAQQSSSVAETDISFSLTTTEGDPLTGTLAAKIAEGQPVQVTISGTGLGSGSHSVRFIEDDVFGFTTINEVTLQGTSDTETFTVQYSELEDVIVNDFGAADLEAQWIDNGEVIASSSEQNLDLAETTVYVDSAPKSVSEGETATVSVYGWSEHDTPHIKLMESDPLDDDQITTKNIDKTGDKFTADITFVPSDVPEENNIIEIYLAPVSGDNGPSSRIHNIEIVDNSPPEADAGANQTVTGDSSVTLDATGSTDPDGDTLSYSWTQTGGTDVTLQDQDTATPEFTAPAVDSTTELQFEVTVSDSHGSSDSSSVTVVVESSDSSNGSDSSGEVDIRVEYDSVVEPKGKTTITVDGINAGDVAVRGETGGWVVNSTDPAGLTTFPNPSNTPYESESDDSWGHLFGAVGNNTFELVVTAPNATGTYNFTAEAADNETAATENFTIEVATITEHESGVSQRTFDAAAGDDGTLERSDVLDIVSAYLRGETIDGVTFTRQDILTLVGYYIR